MKENFIQLLIIYLQKKIKININIIKKEEKEIEDFANEIEDFLEETFDDLNNFENLKKSKK